MKFAVFKEEIDRRVAVVPSTIPKLKDLGLEILIEAGAGQEALYSDAEYEEKGAQVKSRSELLKEAEIAVSIHPLAEAEMKSLAKDTLVISQFQPFADADITGKLKELGLRAFSLDMIPRTTLAQSMDVLSSMASIAGYKAILEAASLLPRYFPMMITAAGSIKPSKVLVLGAGVAGLQAIATARRLGAQVEAFDTRSAAKEEVLSLGAKFVEVEGAVEDKGAGGYGVQQSEEFIKRQRAEVQARAMKSDVIVTTAQVRGRKAPILVPKETVEKMKPGSVIVDLASSTGGNCELTEDLKVIQHNGVYIQGNSSLASLMPQDASFLYSNNLLNFAKVWMKENQLNLDMENEIIASALITADKPA
ncbi:MAG: NAD(P) transhydrogenase subunit alpha [Saprospiraceae bacterium]|nr:NAD(P) transhydrogenase subunit alpha [Saprospiraceae bacterium]